MAKHESGFAIDFAYSVAWLVRADVSCTHVAERFRIDWKTVGRLVCQVWHELEADPSKRLEGPEYRHAYQLCNAVLFSDKNSMA